MKAILIFAALLAFVVAMPAVLAQTDTIGDTTGANSWYGYISSYQITATSSGTLQSIGINLQPTPTGHVQVAIYSSDASQPSSLLAYSASTPAVSGWNDLDVSSFNIPIVAGMTYFVVFEVDSPTINYQNIAGGNSYYYILPYGSFPSTWNGGIAGNQASQLANMRITYSSTTATTTTTPPAGSTTDTIGDTSGTNEFYGYISSYQITATSSGTLQTIGVNLLPNPTGHVQVAIYSQIGNQPNILLAYSASTPAIYGWNDIDVSSFNIPIVAGTTYFVAFEVDSPTANYQMGQTGNSWYYGLSYGSFPAVWGGGMQVNQLANMRITYSGQSTQYQLTISASPSGTGTTNPAAGSYMYNSGTVVSINAVPASGFAFSSWTLDGQPAGSVNPISVAMSAAHALQAIFMNPNCPSASKVLKGANLNGAKFQYCNLAGRDLSGSNLQNANLMGANLQGANLQGSNMHGANLQNANLQNANIQGANLAGDNLRGAILTGANLQGDNLQGANFQGDQMQNANLSGANLQSVNFSGANLQRANLSGANLSSADLSGADLTGAKTAGANFSGANTKGCIGNSVCHA